MSESYNFHNQDAKRVLEAVGSTNDGLGQERAEKLFLKYGPNELPAEKPTGKFTIFFSQINSPLIYILLVAGILSLLLKVYIDAGVIFSAILINIIIGYFQENKANQALLRLKELVEHKSIVLRDNQDIIVDSRQITIGDVILLAAGNRIPADARILEASDLLVNESSLTGESIPSKKKTDIVPLGAALADRENMAYAGTIAVHGHGRAVVTDIGEKTEIGKIAELVRSTKEEKTPLQARLRQFSRTLGIVFALACTLIIGIGIYQGRGFLQMVTIGAAVGVASIPEGLTVAVTFILALGMQRILREKALIRKLVATETLGSTTVICSDKTGTLTEGKMHVAHIVIGEKEYEVDSPGSRLEKKEARIASLALQTAMMCNDAKVENPGDELGSWRFIGSPTEIALLSAAIQSGLNKDKLLAAEPRIAEMPFDSDKKFMLSLHQKNAQECVLYEKGAPEILLRKSARFYHHGNLFQLDGDEKKKLVKVYESMTSQGLRVIGLAIRQFKNFQSEDDHKNGVTKWDEIDQDLVFIGFIAIKDPLRPEAAETIRISREAGIRPVIITGDHKLTAKAIAREVGLNPGKENIIDGEHLDKISDDELGRLVSKIDIYARVSPHHKLRIIKALQARGEVVAMTGDGINDAPALKMADIGISLGTGTDIAKETSDIVLLDNNFKTIVKTIEQGRIIFKNIRKVITYLISDSFSEMILVVGSILIPGIPLALLPTQILWINIVNDGFPSFSLAFEGGDKKIMKLPPLKRDEPLLNNEIKTIVFGAGIIRDIVVLILFYYLWSIGTEIGYLRTLIFAVLGIKSLMAIFSIRALRRPIWRLNPFSNKYLLATVGLSGSLLVLGVYWQPLQAVLSTQALDFNSWILAVGVGLFTIMLIELVKFNFSKQIKISK